MIYTEPSTLTPGGKLLLQYLVHVRGWRTKADFLRSDLVEFQAWWDLQKELGPDGAAKYHREATEQLARLFAKHAGGM